MFVDAGDFTGDAGTPGRMLTAALIDGMNRLGYTVANLSRREFLHGYDTFLERRSKLEFPLISANLVWQDSGKPVVDPTHIEKVSLRHGASVKSLRIGFIGLSKSDPTFLQEGPDGRRIVTTDPVAAAASHLPTLARKADIVVALSSLDLNSARNLARKVEGIDLILGGYGAKRTRSDDFPEDTRVGRTSILYIGDQGKNLGEVRMFFDAEGAIARTQRTVVGLTRDWPETPQLAELMDTTKRAVNTWNREQATAVNPFAAIPAGGLPVYTGSARCAPCHEEAFRTWDRSGHAHAFATLVEAEQDYNPKCVGCHSVGFGKSHGFVNLKATPGLVNVGCESCHGPSSRHPDEELEGYGRTSLRSCVTCHTTANSPDYNPTTYIPKVRHWDDGRAAAR